MALLEGRSPCSLLKQLFINQLTESPQVPLAIAPFTEVRASALETDKLWNADHNSLFTIERFKAALSTTASTRQC